MVRKTLVSAIIPARNEEASISRAVESVAAQPEIGEVIVVDDQSTDRTAAILADLSARIPKLKILHVETVPPGWTGKNHAVSIGALAARGDWLLFTDADTYHYPGSTRRALNDAVEHDAVLVSYSPEQEMDSWWERVLIPFIYCRLASKFSFARVNDPTQPDAAANGQFVLVLRDAYDAAGGHAAVSGEILEDVALARRIKQSGHAIYFTAPIGVVRTRMYRSFAAMWEGWTKNLYPLMGGSLKSLLVEVAEVFPIPETVIAALLLVLRADGVRASVLAGMLGLIAGMLIARGLHHMASLYRNLYPVSYIQYYVPALFLYCAALIVSSWKSTRGRVLWKGRKYAVKAS